MNVSDNLHITIFSAYTPDSLCVDNRYMGLVDCSDKKRYNKTDERLWAKNEEDIKTAMIYDITNNGPLRAHITTRHSFDVHANNTYTNQSVFRTNIDLIHEIQEGTVVEFCTDKRWGEKKGHMGKVHYVCILHTSDNVASPFDRKTAYIKCYGMVKENTLEFTTKTMFSAYPDRAWGYQSCSCWEAHQPGII